MADHKDLEVWKMAIELAKAVYELTAEFPASEVYGLVPQMRRSAVSIASNIAEGAARNADKEFMHFLYVTPGSTAELDTQYILSKELQLTGGSAKVEKDIESVRRLTLGLIRHLKNK
ncbi:MAG TPA: four helix bundle protein [Syntrophobacteraceae bacterium]|nr:four helix bundle protein [Syntrophobacteraceae bacterium]